MLARRIIPVMLTRGEALVKGRNFSGDRIVGHALQAARIHATRATDEICILDVAATREGRTISLSLVEALTETAFVPVAVGGGIRTLQHIRDLLGSGADRVVIGQAARDDPTFIRRAADRYGSQAITVSVDYPRQSITDAVALAEHGAGEILFQNVERDGTQCGLDLPAIKAMCEAVSVPVVVAGGCRDYHDALLAIEAGASGVGVGAAFLFDDLTPAGMARYLHEHGVEVRC